MPPQRCARIDCIATGGTLGILNPPSVVMIVETIIGEVNIVNTFAAALIPGILAPWCSSRPSRFMCAWCQIPAKGLSRWGGPI